MRVTTITLELFALIACASALHAAQAPCQEELLLPADPGDDARFGEAVALWGDVALCGALKDDGQASGAGAAYVHRRGPAGWQQEAKLLAADGQFGDRMGGAVALREGVALLGAHEDDDQGPGSGSAYVFRYDGAGWFQEQKLLPMAGQAGDAFGTSVALDAGRALVGGEFASGPPASSGAAWVFHFDGNAWTEEQRLVASDASSGDDFGVSVALSGDVALVGAALESENGSLAGAAYVFRRVAGVWVEEAKLTASDGSPNDRFGFAVALEGDYALIGAFSDDVGASTTGSAYVFRYDGNSWVEEQKLFASDAAAADAFGWSVAITDGVAAVGARLEDDAGLDAGAVYVYRWAPGSGLWLAEGKFVGSSTAAGDAFGYGVSAHGDRVLAGAWGDDDGAREAGSAFVFAGARLDDCQPNFAIDGCELVSGAAQDVDGNGIPDGCQCALVATYCTAKTASVGCQPSMRLTGLPRASAIEPFDVAAHQIVRGKNGILFYGTSGQAAVSFQGGTLCVAPPVTRTAVQFSGGGAAPDHCGGSFHFDFNALIGSLTDPTLVAGAIVRAQYWYRDPAASFGSGLSDAAVFTICP